MPIYEYQCQSCEHEFETLRKISDPPLEECPQCHQPSLKKKVSAAGFRLKGGGWYETDFKTGKKKNVATDSAADSSKGESKGGSKPAGGDSTASKGTAPATGTPSTAA